MITPPFNFKNPPTCKWNVFHDDITQCKITYGNLYPVCRAANCYHRTHQTCQETSSFMSQCVFIFFKDSVGSNFTSKVVAKNNMVYSIFFSFCENYQNNYGCITNTAYISILEALLPTTRAIVIPEVNTNE